MLDFLYGIFDIGYDNPYDDAPEYHPFENETDYDPQYYNDGIAIGVGKLTYVHLSWKRECGTYERPGETCRVSAKFDGRFDDDRRVDDEYPDFRQGRHERPATTEGLRELLMLVRNLARDLRERGPCPSCGGRDIQLLRADFCAACCLDAIAGV